MQHASGIRETQIFYQTLRKKIRQGNKVYMERNISQESILPFPKEEGFLKQQKMIPKYDNDS